jgi:predicted metal-dependent hydrolase
MPDLLRSGIVFFNDGRYFEAHEAWEDMWRPAQGPLRLYFQGLVQAAVGLHHLQKGNLRGATAQLKKSLSKLEQYPARFCGVDNAALVADLRDVLEERATRPIHIKID